MAIGEINGNSAIEQLIDALIRTESRPKIALQDKKSLLNRKQAVLSDLDSRLSALNSLAERLTSSLTDHFGAKAATSSNTDIFSISATSAAALGNHDISIERLAKIDTRVSQQYTSAGSDLQTFFGAGAQTFEIEVAHPTSADSNNRVSISVNVAPTGSTNEEILDEIADAINTAFDSAVTAGTIDSEERVTASVVHEENGIARLVVRSGKSGFTNRLDFTDSANSLLSTLEINANVQTSGTSGGYVTSIGTTASDSELNAKFVVDGLTFYRDSNTVSDVLDGITLTFNATTTSSESFQVASDLTAVRKEVDDFLNAYNDVILFLKEKTSFNTETDSRGVLAGEGIYRSLRSGLRDIMTSKITNVESGNPGYLAEIGITAQRDGTLSITDSEKFESALASGAASIADLFNSSDGVATQVEDLVKQYTKIGGFLDDSKDNITDRVKNLDNRIARMDVLLARREEQLRSQFSKMQETATLLQNQQSMFQSILSVIG